MKKFLAVNIVLLLFVCCGEKKTSMVPEWSKTAIWYQIFPERFNNGDKGNDPKIEDMKEGWPYDFPQSWKVSSWTSDWYKLNPWEKTVGKDFYTSIGSRRYGGDIQGIIDKLDYLEDLGITAIYLNPVFESPSLHKYDCSMYRHIDDNFGPNPAEDKKIIGTEIPDDETTWKWTNADKLFLKLVDEVHKRGMKIIIDGVFNHVGSSFWAFKDVVKNQQNSKYKDWFYIEAFDNPQTPGNEFKYKGWFGVKDLPELKETKDGMYPEIEEHIFKIVKRWMDPNNDGNPSDGIDGWRLDVADMVNKNFWKKFRRVVKGINPDAYITGEVWWKDWQKNEMQNGKDYLTDELFDGIMNYRYARLMKNFISDNKLKVDPIRFTKIFQRIMLDYAPEKYLSVQNLNSSHDVERLATQIVNPDLVYDHGGKPNETKGFKIRKPNKEEIEKQKLFVGMQMTLPGAPMIYYGDEAGMWGGDDPDCRKPMVWPELEYEPETNHPLNEMREPDSVKFNNDLFNWYKKLIEIRKENKALSVGRINFIKMAAEGVLCYIRSLGKDEFLILVNNNSHPEEVMMDAQLVHNKETLQDIIDGRMFSADRNKFKLKLSPYNMVIFKI